MTGEMGNALQTSQTAQRHFRPGVTGEMGNALQTELGSWYECEVQLSAKD